MLAKYLKIQIIILLFGCLHEVYAQNNMPPSDAVSTRFNNYLRTIHLNGLIKVTNFSMQKTVGHYGQQAEISLTNVQLLTIEPDDSFAGPLEFAAAWRKLQQKLEDKQNIYWQLFFKLAEFSGQDPHSLAIMITTSKPRIYSILVYYDKIIRIDGPETEIKGISNVQVLTDPSKDFVCSTYLPHQPYSGDLQKRLVVGIYNFLHSDVKSHYYKDANVDVQNRDESFIIFKASNLHGKITPNFYESIELYLSLTPTDPKNINIGYNFNLRFGSEPYTLTRYAKDYEDGLQKYALEMAQFNKDLSLLIQKIIKSDGHSK